MLLLFIPLMQYVFPVFRVEPLHGWMARTEKQDFTLRGWFTGEYQQNEEKYLNENFGFRNFFVRLNNQLAYSFFGKFNAVGVVKGKENYLYEDAYINSYYGTDFIGQDSIRGYFDRFKFIQDTLEKLNKTFMLVYTPGKGYFYPEYIPDEYHRERSVTNYDVFVSLAKEYGIKNIDFHQYFRDQKNISAYSLFPQYGIHWSKYAICLALDSMIRNIEQARNIDMPDMYWNEVELAQPKDGDYDIGLAFNLLFNLKSFEMGYPQYHFENEEGKDKPSLLVVADSFFWGIYHIGLASSFSRVDFWYYNKQAYPDDVEVAGLNLRKEIEDHDVIMILGTDISMRDFGWGFGKDVSELFRGEN